MLPKTIATTFLLSNVLVILFFHTEAVVGNDLKICKVSRTKQSPVVLSVGMVENGEGDGGDSKPFKIKMEHSKLLCGHVEYYCMSGGTKGLPVDTPKSGLTFHRRCGKNIAIINKGRTVQKINENDPINSVAFTNRPLKDNEIFEVRLDKKLAKYSYSLGIGIITSNPDNVNILPEMWKSPSAMIYHHNQIYSNGAAIVSSYGTNINGLTVGDRVGVMRTEFGTLHFYINGVDQGPAASNVPSPVYGLFELWNNAAKATIVNAKSPTSS